MFELNPINMPGLLVFAIIFMIIGKKSLNVLVMPMIYQ